MTPTSSVVFKCARCGQDRAIKAASVRFHKRTVTHGALCQPCSAIMSAVRRNRKRGVDHVYDLGEGFEEHFAAINRDRED